MHVPHDELNRLCFPRAFFAVCNLFYFLGNATPQPLTLRVRRAIDYLDMPYQLRYIGQPELGKICTICLFVRFFNIF